MINFLDRMYLNNILTIKYLLTYLNSIKSHNPYLDSKVIFFNLLTNSLKIFLWSDLPI